MNAKLFNHVDLTHIGHFVPGLHQAAPSPVTILLGSNGTATCTFLSSLLALSSRHHQWSDPTSHAGITSTESSVTTTANNCFSHPQRVDGELVAQRRINKPEESVSDLWFTGPIGGVRW